MKNNLPPQNQKQTIAFTADNTAGVPATEKEFAPSADEVARRAYFTYVNEGSSPGRDVQHWLAAEADVLKERELTRTHKFHNAT